MFIYIVNLYLNMFKWEGLPETCLERALERTLFFYGKALFFRDDAIYKKGKYPEIISNGTPQYWHTPCNLQDGFNIYYENIRRTAYSYDYNKEYTIANSVVIRANRLQYPAYLTAEIYARKLVDAGRTIDVVAENMKTPYILTATEDNRLSVEKFVADVKNNAGAILVTKSFNLDGISVMPTASATSNRLTDVWENRHSWLNELLTLMGMDNAHTDKRERLVTGEVEANNDLVQASLGIMLDARKEACEEINKMFGLNVSVRLRREEDDELPDDPLRLSETAGAY